MHKLLRLLAARPYNLGFAFLAITFTLFIAGHAFAADGSIIDPNSDMAVLLTMLQQAGLGVACKWVVLSVSIASLLNAAIPQPAPGSHWLPVRKVLSIVALSVRNAADAGQPAMMTWIARVLQPLVNAQVAQQAAAAKQVMPAPSFAELTRLAAGANVKAQPAPPAPAAAAAPPSPSPDASVAAAVAAVDPMLAGAVGGLPLT